MGGHWLLPWVFVAFFLLLGTVAVLAIAVLMKLYRLWRRRPLSIAERRERFQHQREHLEADFLRAATASGKPSGLRWKRCDWERDFVLARDKRSRELTALGGVNIQFEAMEGSEMEGLPAVGNLRHASGVFFFRGGRWRTVGKAVFNLNPGETLEHFKGQYERVELK